jgi:pilus assembly protein CpaB
MKFARIAVLGFALLAGGVAAYLASGSEPAPAPKVAAQPSIATTEVLVAAKDIGLGATLTAQDLSWRTWPKAGSDSFITKEAQPQALAEYVGAIARQPFVAEEPIRTQKIVKPNGSGFMAAILPAGMRAVATEISAETGAGGFILPNDRVDVLLTQRQRGGPNGDHPVTSTILRNVRVLAIDQSIQEKNGERTVVGRTATLELEPEQTETLARSKQQGTLSLALRSLADADKVAEAAPDTSSPMTVIRFGIPMTAVQR